MLSPKVNKGDSNSTYLSSNLWLVRLATQDTFTTLCQTTPCASQTGSSSKHTEQPRSQPLAFNTVTVNENKGCLPGGPIGPNSVLFLRKYLSNLAWMCLP